MTRFQGAPGIRGDQRTEIAIFYQPFAFDHLSFSLQRIPKTPALHPINHLSHTGTYRALNRPGPGVLRYGGLDETFHAFESFVRVQENRCLRVHFASAVVSGQQEQNFPFACEDTVKKVIHDEQKKPRSQLLSVRRLGRTRGRCYQSFRSKNEYAVLPEYPARFQN